VSGQAEPTLHETVSRARRLEVLRTLMLPQLIAYGERGEQEEVEAGLELYRRNRKRLAAKAERRGAAANTAEPASSSALPLRRRDPA